MEPEAKFQSVLEWAVWVVEGRMVGLGADYYASLADAAAQKRTRIQLELFPGSAAALGRVLIAQAGKVKPVAGG